MPISALVLEDELSCSICLSLYRNPVSLCCGHSFCKQCVQKALGVQQQAKASYSCPLCRVELGPILELQNNFHLSSVSLAAWLLDSGENYWLLLGQKYFCWRWRP
uniref:RING-type domain-containing protein n=1 Tax=Pavo cristatus TaxID=9049 RepID=A0A8C9FLV2_PAVCR